MVEFKLVWGMLRNWFYVGDEGELSDIYIVQRR